MYKGAWGPSILQILLFAAFTFALGMVKPHYVPGVPKEARTLNGWALWSKCLRGIVPSAALIFIVLGSMGGLPLQSHAIATPTEAGAMGAVGALVLAAMPPAPDHGAALGGHARHHAPDGHGGVHPDRLARVQPWCSRAWTAPKWVEHLLTGLPGGQVGFLIVVNIFVFFLAFFLDFFEIASSWCRMLAPVAAKLGIDLVWFGVLLCVNMQTSFMHPPFGFALFYLRGIADTAVQGKAHPQAGAVQRHLPGAPFPGCSCS